MCGNCLRKIEKRLRRIDQELRAKQPEAAPDLNEAYLRPYRSARELLADLVPKVSAKSRQKKPEPKAPKVYAKWLDKRART
jgi:hypothetical protein